MQRSTLSALIICLLSNVSFTISTPLPNYQQQQPLVKHDFPISLQQQKHATGGKHAAVSCESDICTKIGIQLSKDGGNAADMVFIVSLLYSTSF
jgi:hypothetical protein